MAPSVRCSCLLIGAITALMAWPTLALEASDARTVQVRPHLAPLPDALDELHATIYQTPQPTLSIHNPTAKRLVIKDSAYRPFLRIGPTQVAADFNSAWFHRTNFVESDKDAADIGAPPDWHAVKNGDTFVWQDLRLRIRDSMTLPPGVTGGPPKFMQSFRIPVTLGDISSAISGYFLYRPSPDGVYRTVIADHGNFSEAITVKPLVGKKPGLFIRNTGSEPLTVLGIEGEPFLRFRAGAVLLNPTSVTWKQAAPADTGAPYESEGAAHWVKVSSTGAFGWHDPRMRAQGKTTTSGQPDPVLGWSIPVVVGNNQYTIQGNTWWLPQVTADFAPTDPRP